MRTTTEVKSVTGQVADQDRALRFCSWAASCALIEKVPRMEGAPPMFHFSDPDGNGLVHLEEPAPTEGRA